MNKIRSEEATPYEAASALTPRPSKPAAIPMLPDDNTTIALALMILEDRMTKPEATIYSNPGSVKDFLKLKLRHHPAEVFAVMFLTNRHRLLEYRELFRGTIDGASVHPREVVRAAINCNAAAVVLAHNHPSGDSTPSQADFKITNRLKDALALIDVRVLDHIIVGEGEPYSMAQAGMI